MNSREAVLHALPAEFEGADLERALAETHRDLLTRAGSAATADLLRRWSRPPTTPPSPATPAWAAGLVAVR